VGLFPGYSGVPAAPHPHKSLPGGLPPTLAGALGGGGGGHGDDTGDAAARRALQAGFRACEGALATRPDLQPSGSTATVLLLQSGGRSINVGWCGDSSAVLSRGGVPLVLTPPHRPCNRRERQRVVREGGVIEEERLAGCLAVTRALGGFGTLTAAAAPTGEEWAAGSRPAEQQPQKPAGLSGEPELISEALRSEDEFVLVASDGLWDVISAEKAVRIARAELRAYEDAQMAAEKLVEMALKRGADDNISVVVVSLFAPRPEEAVARQIARQMGHRVNRPQSFVELPTNQGFVRVVGGFGDE